MFDIKGEGKGLTEKKKKTEDKKLEILKLKNK